MGSKVIIMLCLFLAMFVLISTQVSAARDLAETSNTVDASTDGHGGGDQYGGGRGRHYGGGGGHYGGGGHHGGGGGGCHCCGSRRCRCCSAGEKSETQN
ncbi:hypothetical protein ACS0TY_036509 [Phlomoides rotata]